MQRRVIKPTPDGLGFKILETCPAPFNFRRYPQNRGVPKSRIEFLAEGFVYDCRRPMDYGERCNLNWIEPHSSVYFEYDQRKKLFLSKTDPVTSRGAVLSPKALLGNKKISSIKFGLDTQESYEALQGLYNSLRKEHYIPTEGSFVFSANHLGNPSSTLVWSPERTILNGPAIESDTLSATRTRDLLHWFETLRPST